MTCACRDRFLTRTGEVAPPEERFTLEGGVQALRKVTPSLLVVAFATGATFALASIAVHRLLAPR